MAIYVHYGNLKNATRIVKFNKFLSFDKLFQVCKSVLIIYILYENIAYNRKYYCTSIFFVMIRLFDLTVFSASGRIQFFFIKECSLEKEGGPLL